MSSQNAPNIVLIMLDTARVDRFSCYGYSRSTTTYIDQIAHEGLLYERAFSPEVWTLPVVSSVLTGLPPGVHGVVQPSHRLDPHQRTMAELLSKQGYDTLGISSGAWVTASRGHAHGFNEFWETYRLIRSNTSSRLANLINRFYAKYIYQRYDKGARGINRAVAKWLRSRQERRVDRPFFLFIQYLEPHYPYRPPRSHEGLYMPDRQTLTKAKRIAHNPLDVLAGKIILDDQDLKLLNNLYDAEITYLDMRIGELYETLQKAGVLETTALILFADHGENIGDHGLLDHHFCLYDSLIHIPLIIRYPPLFPAGEKLPDIVQTQDLFGTVLKIAGLSGVPGIDDARSLLVEDIRANPREYAVSEASDAFVDVIERRGALRDLAGYRRQLRAIRTRRYKYIEGSDDSRELYDIVDDPQETRNLVLERPDLSHELCERLQQEFESQKRKASEAVGHRDDDAVVAERLRALGYLD